MISIRRLIISLTAVWALSIGLQAQDLGRKPDHLGLVNAQLIRCLPQADRPCFRFYVSVLDSAGKTAPLAGVADRERLQVIQTAPVKRTYPPFFVSDDRTTKAESKTRYILILFDVSGSMNDPVAPGGRRKFEVAQDAVSAVLAELNSGSDYVAIAPFESHHLETISRSRFVSDTDARQQLHDMPQPIQTANTALFSAVIAGVDLLDQQPLGSDRLLIVFTDGMNDVHPGPGKDDAGLLSRDTDVVKVVERVRSAQISTFTIGLGAAGSRSVDEVAMRQIAYPDSSHYISATDSETLRSAFRTVTSQFFSRIRVTTAVDEDSFQKLVGGDRVFQVRLLDESGSALDSPAWPWRSPVSGFEPPTLTTDGDEADAFRGQSALTPASKQVSRGIVQVGAFLFFVAAISFLWFVVPRFVWPEAYIPAPAAWANEPVRQPALRPDVPQDAGRQRGGHIIDPAAQANYSVNNTLSPQQSSSFTNPPASTTGLFNTGNVSRGSMSDSREPGEFTRIFQPAPSQSQSVPPPPSGFTEVFGRPSGSSPIDSREFGSSSPTTGKPTNEPVKPASQSLTDFLKPTAGRPAEPMKPAQSLTDLSASAPLPGSGGTLQPPRWDDPMRTPPSPLNAPLTPVERGPSEHTRIVSRRTTLLTTVGGTAASQPVLSDPVPPSPPLPPPPKPSNRRFVLLIILNVAFLVVATLILYFALKK